MPELKPLDGALQRAHSANVYSGRPLITDRAIPGLIIGTRGRWSEFTTAKGAVAGFATFMSVDPPLVEWNQILFFRDADVQRLRADGRFVFWVEITQADPAAAAARTRGLRPTGRLINVEPLLEGSWRRPPL